LQVVTYDSLESYAVIASKCDYRSGAGSVRIIAPRNRAQRYRPTGLLCFRKSVGTSSKAAFNKPNADINWAKCPLESIGPRCWSIILL